MRGLTYCFFGLLISLVSWLNASPGYAQARLVLDGASIRLQDGGRLVMANPSPDAIVRHSGSIISEGEYNRLHWLIGTQSDTYVIPWGSSQGQYIPLRLSMADGIGEGYFSFATYGTPWRNTAALPSGVGPLVKDGEDMSPLLVDRFWQIDALDYTQKPNLSDVTFSYQAEEVTAEGNTISEDLLQALRWNGEQHSWSDLYPTGEVNAGSHTLTVSSVDGGDLHAWWFLAASTSITPLPVELLYFRGRLNAPVVELEWATASELDSDYFVVERSADGYHFEALTKVKAAGNTSLRRNYKAQDDPPGTGIFYYRLKQVDFDGSSQYSDVVSIFKTSVSEKTVSVYPNPSDIGKLFIRFQEGDPAESRVELFDMTGRSIPTVTRLSPAMMLLEVSYETGIRPGAYILRITNGTDSTIRKVLLR